MCTNVWVNIHSILIIDNFTLTILMSKIVSNHEFEANFSFINFYKIFEMHFIFKYCNITLKKPRYLNVDFDVLSSIFISQGVPYQLIQEK